MRCECATRFETICSQRSPVSKFALSTARLLASIPRCWSLMTMEMFGSHCRKRSGDALRAELSLRPRHVSVGSEQRGRGNQGVSGDRDERKGSSEAPKTLQKEVCKLKCHQMFLVKVVWELFCLDLQRQRWTSQVTRRLRKTQTTSELPRIISACRAF